MTDKELIAELLLSFEMYLFAIVHRAVNPGEKADGALNPARFKLIDAVEAVHRRTEGKA